MGLYDAARGSAVSAVLGPVLTQAAINGIVGLSAFFVVERLPAFCSGAGRAGPILEASFRLKAEAGRPDSARPAAGLSGSV